MQKLQDASIRAPELIEEFEGTWEELVRFLTRRRMTSGSLRGTAGELSHVQIAALTLLGESDLRMGELAGRLGLAESSVTRLIDRLVRAGLVERLADASDRRCVAAGLTTEGHSVLEAIRSERRVFLEDILATLEADERDELVRLFGKVAAVLREQEGASAGGGSR